MESGLYAVYTGLLARTQALDTAANNLANAGTNGFRAGRESFSNVLAGSLGRFGEGASQVGNTINSYGVLGGVAPDFSQGPLVATGNPLDLAVSGQGLFAIRTAQGVRYTRDGSFLQSPSGQLVTRTGEAVLDSKLQPMTLPTGAVHVASDGTLSVETAEGGGVVGKVGVFTFAAMSGLQAEGTNRFVAPAGSVPLPATGEIQQAAVESANQDAVHGTMQLVLMQREAEMMQKALTVFHTDFDKASVEELGKV